MGSLDVDVIGSAELRRLAAQIRARGDRGLGREMTTALARAAKPIERAIDEEYEGLPSRGGYAAAFAKSLRHRRSSRTQARMGAFRITTFADGTHQRRDIGRLEKGELRHPVHGRSRPGRRKGERIPNPWAVTVVRGDFHKRGTDRAIDSAKQEMAKVVAEFSARLIE